MTVNTDSDANRLSRRPRLSEQLAREMTLLIHHGEWHQGQRLPTEAMLGERFNVSRPVVREAVSILRNAGLVRSRRGSGSFVSESPDVALRIPLPEASLAGICELLELRQALEVKAARLAARRHTSSQLRRIHIAMADIDTAVESGGTGVREDMAFHRVVAEAANNDHFTRVIDFYNQFLYRAFTATRTNEARREDFMKQVIAEHEAIVTALARKDADAAAYAVTHHLDNAEWRLRQAPDALFEQVDASLNSNGSNV